jgi:hypothetical protein
VTGSAQPVCQRVDPDVLLGRDPDALHEALARLVANGQSDVGGQPIPG